MVGAGAYACNSLPDVVGSHGLQLLVVVPPELTGILFSCDNSYSARKPHNTPFQRGLVSCPCVVADGY